MKLMNVILFCMLTASCSIYTHDNQTLIEVVKSNGDIERTYHEHDLNIISWRKIDAGKLNISKNGAIKSSADKIDTDVEAVKALNNGIKLGLKLASPITAGASAVEDLIE